MTKITLTIIKTNIFYLSNILTLFFLCYHYIHDMEATDTISEGCSFLLNEGCVFVWSIEKPVWMLIEYFVTWKTSPCISQFVREVTRADKAVDGTQTWVNWEDSLRYHWAMKQNVPKSPGHLKDIYLLVIKM